MRCWLLLLIFSAGLANETIQNDLFAILEQESELATKSKKNIDYLPGLITVLQQKTFKRYGAKTVREVLELVPGIDFSMDNLIMRGVGNAYVSGKAKIMLNGVFFNDTASSNAPYLLQLPIEIVERIEVIRGPGSALYGEYAYNGVINIVTQKESDKLFAGYEDFGHAHDGRHGGLATFYKDPDLMMQLIVTDASSDGPYTKAGSDILYQPTLSSNIPLSHAPGSVEELHDERFYIFDLAYKKFSLAAYALKNDEGAYFGQANALPENDGKPNYHHRREAFEAKQGLSLDDDLELTAKAGILTSEFRLSKLEVFPEGFSGPLLSFPDGIYAGNYAKEEKRYGALELSVASIADHKVLLGAEMSESLVVDTYLERNIDPSTYATLGSYQRFTREDGPLKGNTPSRTVRSLFAQDEWSTGEKNTVTLGLRYDDYDDIGESYSPRIAAVHELSPTQILKVQYAHAFRPPNYLELYMQNNPFGQGDASLKAETVDTYEAAYIFNNREDIVRIGVFYSLLKNLIGLQHANKIFSVYTNAGDATLQGVELEFEKHYFYDTTMRAQLSYVDTQNEEDILNRYANWIATLGLTKRFNHNAGTALLYRYTGEKEREAGDTRSALAASNRVDTSLFYDNFMTKGLDISAGIKNLLDETILYPAPKETYAGDYPRAGRSYWVKAEYRF